MTGNLLAGMVNHKAKKVIQSFCWQMLQKAKLETTEAKSEKSALESKLRDVKVDYECKCSAINLFTCLLDRLSTPTVEAMHLFS